MSLIYELQKDGAQRRLAALDGANTACRHQL
jgi:hypothetical protein